MAVLEINRNYINCTRHYVFAYNWASRIDRDKTLLSDEVISWFNIATRTGTNGTRYPWKHSGWSLPYIIVHRGPAITQNKSQLVDVMNEVWCSDAFAPKYVLRKVLSLSWLLQGHYLLDSDEGITINRYIWAVSGPGRDIHVYQYCSVLCLYSRAGLWLHHAAPLITVWDCHPLSYQSGRGHKRRLLSISDEKEYLWARHVHSRWYIFIHSLSVTSLGY